MRSWKILHFSLLDWSGSIRVAGHQNITDFSISKFLEKVTFFGQNFREKWDFLWISAILNVVFILSRVDFILVQKVKITEKYGLPGFDSIKISEKYGVSKPLCLKQRKSLQTFKYWRLLWKLIPDNWYLFIFLTIYNTYLHVYYSL